MSSPTHRILCIENDSSDLNTVKPHLNKADTAVDVVLRAGQAVAQVAQIDYDCILIAHRVPEIDSLHLISHIRQIDRAVPIAILVNPGDEAVAMEALEKGADHYMVRSQAATFPALVASVVYRACERYAMHRQQGNIEEENYTSIIAHELKQPLTALGVYLHILDQYKGAEYLNERQAAIERCQNTLADLKEMVDSLLLLSQVRHFHEVILEPVAMKPLVLRVIDQLRPLIREQDAVIDLPEEWLDVRGYTPWVERVLSNYLSNALRYGGDPPNIAIECSERDSLVSYHVTDNGPGLRQDLQARVFTTPVRSTQGSGLGLNLVYRIVTQLGGTVDVDVHPHGRGTTFSVSLPVCEEKDRSYQH